MKLNSTLYPAWRILVLAGALLFGVSFSYAQSQFLNSQSVLDEIIALSKNAKYLAAVEVGEKWLEANPLSDDSEESDAAVLTEIALNYVKLNQPSKAVPLQTRDLAIREKVLGPEHPDTAKSLINLAATYGELAQYDKALALELRALAIFEKVLGPEHPNTATALNNLAFTYRELAQYEKALPLYLRALAIYEKVLGPEHPDTARSLNNLASTYREFTQYEKALPLYLRAIAVYEKVLGPQHPNTALSLNKLALIFEDLSNPLVSIALRKTAVNIFQSQRERISGIGKDEVGSYTRSVVASYTALARLLVDQGRLAEAQQVLDMLKEDELFEFIRRSSDVDPRRSRIGFSPGEARWASGYKEVSNRLAALGAQQRELKQKAKRGLSAVEKAQAEAIKAELDVAEKAFTAFLSDMQRTLKAQGPAKVDEVAATSLASQRELQSIIRDLGPDVVLLQYYVTSSKVGVILTTPNVVIPFSTEIDAKVLNRQVFQLKNALRDLKLSVLGPSQSLYQLLLAPVTKALEQTGAKTVMLSLDGQLRHIPFGALHDGTQFAAQRWNFPIYTSVTRDRLRGGSKAKWKAAGLGVTKAIGSFNALPAVKVEMDGLLRAADGQSGQSVVYLDEEFTAHRLKEVGQRDFQLMHISSHFSISPGTEVNSFLLLGDGQRLTLGDMRTQNFRFDNVDLLTLSACDTGVGGGRDNTGKEIEGLGVIAQQQGAKGVLATLWPVADGSTAKLMSDMYQRRQSQGLSKIEALRQAQLAMMSQPKYAHPFYWAPFILLGNWQ
jgi:CHAT domain-containing protein